MYSFDAATDIMALYYFSPSETNILKWNKTDNCKITLQKNSWAEKIEITAT